MDESRRDFLKGMIGSVFAGAAITTLPKETFAEIKPEIEIDSPTTFIEINDVSSEVGNTIRREIVDKSTRSYNDIGSTCCFVDNSRLVGMLSTAPSTNWWNPHETHSFLATASTQTFADFAKWRKRQ